MTTVTPHTAGFVPRVWAPAAQRVDLVLPAGPGHPAGPMHARDGGWWEADGPLPHGTDYAFSLDGGDPRPDPRSAWQPEGVHGPSRVFDPSRHVWDDGAWLGRDVRGRVVYELHVGTFTPQGTFAAAAERLEHLVDLGVDVVELMPVAAFNGAHGWGYDGVSLYAVHEAYGGPAGLQAFVDAAHGAGLAVCLDVVHNHLGPSGNYLGEFGPYFTDAHHTPWGAAINLDTEGSEEVRRWILDSAGRWFRDFHVDALRLDAVHALVDTSDRHVLAELSDETAALGAELRRPLSLIAEVDLNDPVSVTPTAEGGWGMTAQWADDVHHALHALFTGERHGYYVDFGAPATLRKAMTGVFVHDGEMSTFRGEVWGAPVPAEVDGHRFVVFASDHDQVGNRAIGDRPAERLTDGQLAAEAALVLLSPFTPMLFQGEEWGTRGRFQFFTDHPEPELAEAIRKGRRSEFGEHGWAEIYGGDVEVPDPQDPSTLEASKLTWDETTEPAHAALLAWYRRLTQLRREVDDLGSGDRSATDLRWGGDDEGAQDAAGGPFRGWLVLHRGIARVAVNLGDAAVDVPLAGTGSLSVQASFGQASVAEDGTVRLGPSSVAVLA
ncbi:malto-oligosyltrehalose trehalohydrolase [Cellulomonas marina]|uniref:Malto-oligosyltrehalose trehalohydrolase n=1 Tax=Cellulomonas marina TaxID=988821 RepID=A0A1I0W3Q5_9CELL|nr:malto-oligosyltrehalose trehalohydrolase [Cellulomonas marina]GIG29978.1 malto-oligosyltrehalose trehalohydrolase [Cellulomonas marina]SFA83375.1 maltooligosyltrehalose trehalohydrolase [Cellulomonas marina]